MSTAPIIADVRTNWLAACSPARARMERRLCSAISTSPYSPSATDADLPATAPACRCADRRCRPAGRSTGRTARPAAGPARLTSRLTLTYSPIRSRMAASSRAPIASARLLRVLVPMPVRSMVCPDDQKALRQRIDPERLRPHQAPHQHRRDQAEDGHADAGGLQRQRILDEFAAEKRSKATDHREAVSR